MNLELKKAVVLLSGGMDSCVTAAVARADGYRLALLHSDYGQRTEGRERRAFQEMADYFGATERLVVEQRYLAQIGGSSLTDEHIPVSLANLDSKEIPSSYVPFRNAHFLSVAVSWAEVIGAERIYVGAVAADSSGYTDCRPEYYETFRRLVRAGTRPETRMEIVAPLISLHKHEIVKKGIELGAPLQLSWSCYQSSERACGVCDSCALRLRAFEQAGVEDPISYL
ncbi:MAG: 7-cyano-7-deazaguanine synthase QueC [Acidobacteria bacterium]|nr:7-cyano-7-deazaguanine synthase QueC [Acidobacteriota bacterium]